MRSKSIIFVIGAVLAVMVASVAGIVAGDAVTRGQESSGARGVIKALVAIPLALGLSIVLAWSLRLLRRPSMVGAAVLVVAPLLTLAMPSGFAIWAFERYGTLDPDHLGSGAPAILFVMIAGLLASLSGIVRRDAGIASVAVAFACAFLAGLAGLLSLPGLDDGLSPDGMLIASTGLLWIGVLGAAALDIRARSGQIISPTSA